MAATLGSPQSHMVVRTRQSMCAKSSCSSPPNFAPTSHSIVYFSYSFNSSNLAPRLAMHQLSAVVLEERVLEQTKLGLSNALRSRGHGAVITNSVAGDEERCDFLFPHFDCVPSLASSRARLCWERERMGHRPLVGSLLPMDNAYLLPLSRILFLEDSNSDGRMVDMCDENLMCLVAVILRSNG
jgi:hypothetical protein